MNENDHLPFNGDPRFAKDPRLVLLEIATGSFFSRNTFYEQHDEVMRRAARAIDDNLWLGGADFVANAVLFARGPLRMRSMPIALAVQFAMALRRGDIEYPHLRRLFYDVIQRADDVIDALAYAITVFGSKNKVPMAVRRGISDAMSKFDERSFAKYDRDRGVTFKDALRILHPIPKTSEAEAVFAKIIGDSLEVPYTWEVELSRNGALPAEERKTPAALWEELIRSKRLGYMALLSNLRNILNAGVSTETIRLVCERLADPAQVAKTRQLPFRFASAYEMVAALRPSGGNAVRNALVRALDVSLGNLPKIGENVWFIVDRSLSMTQGRTDMGCRPPMGAAALFAATLAKSASSSYNFALTMFSDYAIDVPLDLSSSVMDLSSQIQEKAFGVGTNLQSALDRKASLGFEPDTVVVISDMQVDRLPHQDITSVFPTAMKIAIDISAYSTTPVSEFHGWHQLFGWSDSIMQWISTTRDAQSIAAALDREYLGPDQMAKFGSQEPAEE
jgi:hypothetical protein